MGPRVQVVFLLVALAACSSKSSSSSSAASAPVASRGPNGSVGSSGGSSSGAPSVDVPKGCPSGRQGSDALAELTEEIVRERLPGMYRSCSGARTGIEIRVDAGSGDIVFWQLDERFVRESGSGSIAIESCSGDTCNILWQDATTAETRNTLRVYADPTALELYDPAAFEGSPEWVRVAD